jgi:hypothetical protein
VGGPVTALDVLKAARERISDPKRWCKGVYFDPATNQCCMQGAVWHASEPSLARGLASEALRKLAQTSLPAFNDTHTHAEVLALFDEAIAAEQAKETK